MTVLRRDAAAMLGDFARFAKRRLFAALALIALGIFFEAIGLLWLAGLARLMLDPHAGHASALARVLPFAGASHPFSERLALALAAFGALILLRAAVVAARDRLLARLQFGYVEHVKLGVMRALAAASYRSVSRIRHDRVVQGLTLDLQQISVAVSFALQSAVALAMMAGVCVFALLLSPVAAVAILFVLAGFAAAWPLLRRARGLSASLFRNHLRMTDGTLRLIDALKAAKAQNLHHRFLDELECASGAAMRDRVAFMDLQSSLRNLWSVLLAGAAAATVALGLIAMRMEPEILFGLLIALSRLGGPALTFHQGVHHVLHGVPAYRALRAIEHDLASPPPRVEPAPAGLVYRDSAFALEFRGVTYRHADGDAGIRDLDLSIAPGEFVGIAGPSGAGKTTLIDLAAGLIEPQSGSVSAHGLLLAGDALERHRDRLSYVAQDAFLFEEHLRRNFLMACPDADDARILAAVELAGAGEVVARLGLDGEAGPRGNQVSAGERQRLALACALLRAPDLLILDEATNAVDLANERAILARLAALDPRPTILMIAHRPDSLAFCDRVLTVRDGALVEEARPAPARAQAVPRLAGAAPLRASPA